MLYLFLIVYYSAKLPIVIPFYLLLQHIVGKHTVLNTVSVITLVNTSLNNISIIIAAEIQLFVFQGLCYLKCFPQQFVGNLFLLVGSCLTELTKDSQSSTWIRSLQPTVNVVNLTSTLSTFCISSPLSRLNVTMSHTWIWMSTL